MIKAYITAEVIQWARESMKLSIEDAAKCIGRPVDEIKAWENGDDHPTIAQARKAAEVYKRPLAIFYLPEPPKDFQTLRDYRRLPEGHRRDFSPDLALLIRESQMKQEWLREYLISEESKSCSLVGAATEGMDYLDLVRILREFFNFNVEEQFSIRKREELLKRWIEKVENKGIVVSRNSQIDCLEARGFVLVDKYAPFIFINTNDSVSAQLFTLIHEIVHLALNQPGVSNLENQYSNYPSSNLDRIESYCNKVAGEVLLDDKVFISLWEQMTGSVEEKIKEISKQFKTSEEVVARRSLNHRIITKDVYEDLREQYRKNWEEFKKIKKEEYKKREGGPSPHLLRVITNGYSYTRTVLSAYFSGKISGRETSGLLNVKLNNIRKVAAFAHYALSS